MPDLDGDLWRESANESYSNGVLSVHQYNLGDGQRLFIDSDQGYPQGATITDEEIEQYLANWDWSNLGYIHPAELLSEIGLDGLLLLEEAPKDYEGSCAVWREPHYNQGHYNAPTARLDRVEDAQGHATDEVRVFPTHEEAEEYVSGYYSEPSAYDGIPACNVLSYGQASADTLTIVKWDE